MIINRPSYSGITLSLYLNNQQINMEQQQKILGLIFDTKLNWELHIKKVKANCQQRIKIIKTLASKSWGANSEIILRTYKAIIRPVLDYGAPIYGSAPKRLLKILDPIQTTSLRLSLGAFKTSPNLSVIVETGEIPSEYRRRQLSLALAATKYSNQRNPCYETLITHNNQQIYLSRNTLPKPFSIRQARYASDWNLTIPQITQRLPAPTPPWKLNNPNINFELSNLNKKETSAIIYQSRFSEIANKYRNHKHIYTDGSINKEQGGCAIITDNQELTYKIPKGISIFACEAYAILQALRYIKSSEQNLSVIFTDSKSVLLAMEDLTSTTKIIQDIHAELTELQIEKNVQPEFVWIPSHQGIVGNERADEAAKKAITLEEPYVQILPTLNETKNLIKKKQQMKSGTRNGPTCHQRSYTKSENQLAIQLRPYQIEDCK
ncbi:uncharacterized protein LOC128875576 [Hylaeus volcanicus]|uniref:uncharacterized protein LOC128875576 n=1 Tax=Hylaeus volcanicus TaxID=313075 RepID=UPI0023B80EA9|nr:uncharacterized protein LOC128875576 [Hylaeus volcanicus]